MTASTDEETARLVDLAGGAAPVEWLALSAAAHWNQTEDDWRTMLALGRGWGLRCRDPATGRDTLVASTLVLPYGAKFAWISMVLVLPAWRGHGFAARLLGVALADLRARGLLPVLDATPAGRPVYLKQGFVDAWRFERWRRRAGLGLPAAAPASAAPAAPRPRALHEADWSAIDVFDGRAFGASRMALLRALARRLPEAAWVAEGAPGPAGYLLGRPGRTALQLGPLVADDQRAAVSLLDAALATLAASRRDAAQDVIVDLRCGLDEVAAWLRGRGFEVERPFTRMVHDPAAVNAPGEARPETQAPGDARLETQAPGDARRVVLVAGPELG